MLIQADARSLPLADNSVQCVVTSPPYWGLRDYGTATWKGGDPTCAHQGFAETRGTQPGKCAYSVPVREVCRCGARRSDRQVGLEGTPDEYVAKMVAIFREVGRVLRDDGVVWLNLGDSYVTKPIGGGSSCDPKWPLGRARREGLRANRTNNPSSIGLKHKDLIGMPWRMALALQADGWYLRTDIIWDKVNPMPESVSDRPTRSHEYIFLFAKNERYYYDAEAIKEPVSINTHARGHGVNPKAVGKNESHPDRRKHGFNERWRVKQNASFSAAVNRPVELRNKRTVWRVGTQAFHGSHFATFPEDLIAPCILAGSRVGDRVCDPFVGSGTTVRVATSLGRFGVGCDLNLGYLRDLAVERTRVTRGLPLEMEASAWDRGLFDAEEVPR